MSNEKEPLFHTRNKHGIRMARCCMSCAHKEESELMTLRVCSLDKVKHSRYHMCHDWQMSPTMQRAGLSGGIVRDKVTKQVLLN